jgi:methyltransferase
LSPILIGVVVFVFMLTEARRAARNERTQRARGGLEPGDDVYQAMRLAYPAAFLVMIGEGAVRGGPPRLVLTAGAVLFAASKALKWWAIVALGSAWTFRVIVIPGVPLTTSGPYRILRHPNYLAVVGELVGVALMTGSAIAGPGATAGFCLLIAKRIAVEKRELGRKDRAL